MRQVSFGSGGPPPRDVIAMLVIVAVTFSLTFFTSLLELLRLTPLVWQKLFVWQAVTYPWIGSGGASFWILLELLILYWFASDVFRMLGRRRFWELFLVASIGAAALAIVADLLAGAMGALIPSFALMQGQRMLILIAIAAFATLRSEATILLFFVLPIKAKWFIWLEIALGFIGFLGSKDFPGFVGICGAVGISTMLLGPGGLRASSREARLRMERWWIQRKLGRMRKKSQLKIVKDEERGHRQADGTDKGPWIN